MNVFISYAPSDRDVADGLADALSEYGLGVWRTDEHVLPGENWAKKVGEALDEADALVVILSPGSEDMQSIKREISFAMGNKRFKNKIVPVYRGDKTEIEEDIIPWSLRGKVGVSLDAYSKREEAFEEVARWLKKEQNPA